MLIHICTIVNACDIQLIIGENFGDDHGTQNKRFTLKIHLPCQWKTFWTSDH